MLGVPQDAAGDLVRRSDPAAQGPGRVDQGRRRAGRRDAGSDASPRVDHHRQPERPRTPRWAAHPGPAGRPSSGWPIWSSSGRTRSGRAVPLVLRLRRRRRAVAQRVVRPGRARGPGLRPAGGGHRCRRAAARRRGPDTGLLVAGHRSRALGRRTRRTARRSTTSGRGWGPPQPPTRRGSAGTTPPPRPCRVTTRPWPRPSRRCRFGRSDAPLGCRLVYHVNVTGRSGVIGYYVHHQGRGHLHRARAVAEVLGAATDRAVHAAPAGRLARRLGRAGRRRRPGRHRRDPGPDACTMSRSATPACAPGWHALGVDRAHRSRGDGRRRLGRGRRCWPGCTASRSSPWPSPASAPMPPHTLGYQLSDRVIAPWPPPPDRSGKRTR